MKDDANATTRSPFVVPGQGNPEPKAASTPQCASPTTSTPTNPFRWVVPSGATGNESPALPGHDHGTSHKSTQINDNDAHGQAGQPRRLNPVGSSRLLDDHDDEDDDRTSVNGHSEEWQPIEDGTPWPGGTGDDDGGHVTGDDDDRTSRTETHGGDGDRLLAQLEHESSRSTTTTLTTRSNVTVSDDGGNRVDSTRLREGVQIGTVKRELLDYRPRTRRTHKKQSRLPFSPQIPKILDFLTRFRLGTTSQLARIAGWTDSNEQRLVKKLRVYDEVGFLRETNLYAGPKIWTARERGAELGFHPWLGGVKESEINPMSQSHSFGLSSIASWLLCPWDDTPNILGLAPVEWRQVRCEIREGTAYVLAEKEYRSSYSSLRTLGRGLIPAEYRHGFIGDPGGLVNPVHGAWREWARRFKNGDAGLGDSPELLACDPEFMGSNLWMWVVWGNSVWNPKVLETRAAGEVDVDAPEWSGRDGGASLRSEFRRYGYVPIEERLDIATNKPVLNKALGDRFALWDHLPDLIIARRRTNDGYADPQSIAIELELSAKTPEAYARTMASYGSPLGQTLYRKVIWLVSSKTIADRIRAGASQVGMILGEDYDIVPFVTSNKVAVIKSSFYSGSDILPGKWNQRGIIEPCEDGRSIPLA